MRTTGLSFACCAFSCRSRECLEVRDCFVYCCTTNAYKSAWHLVEIPVSISGMDLNFSMSWGWGFFPVGLCLWVYNGINENIEPDLELVFWNIPQNDAHCWFPSWGPWARLSLCSPESLFGRLCSPTAQSLPVSGPGSLASPLACLALQLTSSLVSIRSQVAFSWGRGFSRWVLSQDYLLSTWLSHSQRCPGEGDKWSLYLLTLPLTLGLSTAE